MSYKISLAAVNVPDEAYSGVEYAMRAGKIGQSELIEIFEHAVARYVGARHCIAVSNGTMADAVAVAALKAANPGVYKSVVVPALTFIAQPNSVRYNGLRVEFADINEDWTLNWHECIPIGRSRILFATDLMGIQASGPFELEDACEAFGSRHRGRYSGTFGLMGTYSFYPSHTISTGEGGAIVTDDADLASLCRSIRAHGSGSTDPMDKFHFPNFGFNARMTSIQAVLGCALMKHIDEYIITRRRNFVMMQELIGGFPERPEDEIVPHGYPVEFESEKARNAAMLSILFSGIECRKFFSCIPYEEPQYLEDLGEYPVADHVAHTHLYVPCHQNMTGDDVHYVADVVCSQNGRVRKSTSRR